MRTAGWLAAALLVNVIVISAGSMLVAQVQSYTFAYAFEAEQESFTLQADGTEKLRATQVGSNP